MRAGRLVSLTLLAEVIQVFEVVIDGAKISS